MSNRLQELGLALSLGLYLYGAIFTAFTDKTIRWAWWFWSAPAFIGYVMVSSSVVFAINANVEVMASLFAAREFLIIFLAPAIYFLYRLGFPLKKIEKIFITSLVLIAFNYLFFYYTTDLKAAYFSKGYMSYQVTFDEWRGYRLKPPTVGLIILTFYGFIQAFRPGSAVEKSKGLLLLGLVGYIWSLIMARSQFATMMLAIMVYPILFIRANRMNLFILVAPLGLMLLIGISDILIDHFLNADGAEVRAESYGVAWNTLMELPFLGYGQSSGYSKTYQDIFGPKFFPDDLGLIGIAFKYGFIGVALYLFFHFYIATRLLKANWYYRKRYSVHNPVIWSMFMLMVALSVNLILVTVLAYMQGLTTAAFAIAITACYYEELGIRRGKSSTSQVHQ